MSLATPTPPPCSSPYPWGDRAGTGQAPWDDKHKMGGRTVVDRKQGGPHVPSPSSWGGAALPTVWLLHLLQEHSPGAFLPSSPTAEPGWCLGLLRVFTHAVHARCVCANYVFCGRKPQFPEGHQRHFTTVGMSSSQSPAHGATPSHFLSTCQAGAGKGEAQKGGVGVPGASDIPRLGQITEAASFQELEPSVLTPCAVPEGGTAGLSAHSSKKTKQNHRQQKGLPKCSHVGE